MNTYNFNRIHVVFMAFAILLLPSAVWATGTYDDGDGSQGDPFQINTPTQMDEIGQHSEDWGSYFLLTADINLSEYTGTEFNIIDLFTGVFDGNDHTISNFTYTSTGADHIGLFRNVYGLNAEIKNLGLIEANVDAGTGVIVGSLVGWLQDGTVTGCYVEGGNATGVRFVGGLVGSGLTGGVINSFWDMDTSGRTYSAGGTGKTTAEMQTQNTFTDYGWDFVSESANGTDNYWRLCVDGIKYPELAWQSITADLACPAGVDLGDFAFFASRWLEIDCDTSNDCGGSDMDLSTDVGLSDLQLFLGNWLADSL